jgi:uncharacterized protein YndB with AHSA1/START domain
MNTDRIVKQISLRAPRSRVWRAISNSSEFGTWFGLKFDGPFVAGQPVRGILSPTKIDAEVGQAQKPHEGLAFEIVIDQIQPEHLFSLRWHPFAVDPAMDYSAEPMTLVTFELEETAEGTLLTVTESGFDKLPMERRAKAFTANEGGWTMMVRVIAKYVDNAQ